VDAPLGEIPSIIVLMPDGLTERDTTPARLSPAGAAAGAAAGVSAAPIGAAGRGGASNQPVRAASSGGGAGGGSGSGGGGAEAAVEYSYEWQEVPAGASVPPGMAYTLPLEGQPRRARIPPCWQLQLWSEKADAFYRIKVEREWTVSEVEAALLTEGPSLPRSLQRDWGPVTLAVTGGAGRPRRLARELTVEGSRLFNLKQAGQLVLLYESDAAAAT
jgi:hypothetical protein